MVSLGDVNLCQFLVHVLILYVIVQLIRDRYLEQHGEIESFIGILGRKSSRKRKKYTKVRQELS